MKRWWIILGIVLLIVIVVRELFRKHAHRVYLTTAGRVEMCLACHKEAPEKVHAREVVGCSPCHKGDPLRIDKHLAHRGLIKNPGDLRVADKTCGQPSCHPQRPEWVKRSLMATNRGIINVVRRYWGEINDDPPSSIKELIDSGKDSIALDYIRKLCGSCHLWFEKGKYPGFLKEKGGGCVACHLVPPKKKGQHPILTLKIPTQNCARCHNRSGRIGLTYQGLYESEGYGTPFINGDFGAETLSDGRFVRHIPPDVHYKAGLSCVDCHLKEETMGDGHSYSHFEESVEITCESCHGGDGRSRKGRPIPGIKRRGNKLIFIDHQGKKHQLKPPDPVKCRHQVHRRLSCQACHARYVPQCYGCHIRRDLSQKQLDKLSSKKTPGAWEEFRSYMRYEEPTLGVLNSKIVILVPGCQDFVSLLSASGKLEKKFRRLTWSFMDPHNTGKARTCKDCHTSAKTLGLGYGVLTYLGKGKWAFQSIEEVPSNLLEINVPLSGLTNISGTPLTRLSRKDLRPFSKEEISRILRVGLCLPCHPDFSDPVMHDWDPKVHCPVFKE